MLLVLLMLRQCQHGAGLGPQRGFRQRRADRLWRDGRWRHRRAGLRVCMLGAAGGLLRRDRHQRRHQWLKLSGGRQHMLLRSQRRTIARRARGRLPLLPLLLPPPERPH